MKIHPGTRGDRDDHDHDDDHDDDKVAPVLVEFGAISRGRGYALSTVMAVAMRNRCWAACFVVP